MLKEYNVLLWLLLCNGSALLIGLWSLFRLPPSPVRRAFFLFLLGYLLWSNPLIAIQLLSPESCWVRLASQCVLGGGSLFLGFLGHFLIYFANPSETRTFRYFIFQLQPIIFVYCSFAGLFESGVVKAPLGIAPIPGPLMPYFNGGVLVLVGYFITICWRALKRTQSELLKVQLHTIFWACVPSLTLAVTTNALLPALTGNFTAAPIGSLWFIFMFAGIAHLLVHGRAVLAYHTLSKILKEPAMGEEKNQRALEYLINSFGLLAQDKPSRFKRRATFLSNSGKTFHAYLSHQENT